MSLKAMVWVFDESPATLGARLVLLALAERADDDGADSYPSIGWLAKKARLSERAVQYALRKLESAGEIEDTGISKYGTTNWRIVGLAGGVQILHPGGANSAPGGVQSTTLNKAQIAPEPLSKPEASKEASPCRRVFDAWVAARVEFKPGTSPSSFRLTKKREALIRRQLNDYPVEDLVDAVRGWLRSPFHRGVNDRNRPFHKLELLLRDADHIEEFRDLEREHRERSRPRAVPGGPPAGKVFVADPNGDGSTGQWLEPDTAEKLLRRRAA